MDDPEYLFMFINTFSTSIHNINGEISAMTINNLSLCMYKPNEDMCLKSRGLLKMYVHSFRSRTSAHIFELANLCLTKLWWLFRMISLANILVGWSQYNRQNHCSYFSVTWPTCSHTEKLVFTLEYVKLPCSTL